MHAAAAGALLLSLFAMNPEAESLFVAEPFTAEGSFTTGIEGPACDAAGNVYAVCIAAENAEHTIGRVTPDGVAELFVRLPDMGKGNGIRFDRAGVMYVADYQGHNILRIDVSTKAISVFAHGPEMNQPNDIAITADGTLYASDPNWEKGTGQVWKIGRDASVVRVAPDMGTTNGIDLSPDGKRLYVNESAQRSIWVFDVAEDGTLANKQLLIQFADHGFDGMRVDVDGNLYVTRYGKGTVAKISPAGEVMGEIDVLGAKPSNLCFGGPDGRTVYVTEVEHTRLVKFRVDRPGLEWQRWQDAK